MKSFIGLLLSAAAAFGCSNVLESDCPLPTASSSFATITNSASGLAPSGVESRLITYETSHSLKTFEYRPVGLSSYSATKIIICLHDGGLSAGDAITCFGIPKTVGSVLTASTPQSLGSVSAGRPTQVVQLCGCVLYMPYYRLSAVAIMPAQWQDAYQLIFWIVASGDGNVNDINIIGYSGGAYLSRIVSSTATNWSQNGSNATTTAFTISRVATISTYDDVAGANLSYTAAQSNYQNTCYTLCANTLTDVINLMFAIQGTVSGVSNTNPAVVTSNSNNIATGNTVTFSGFTGSWTPLNGQFTMTALSGTTFSVPINSTAFGAVTGTPVFTSGYQNNALAAADDVAGPFSPLAYVTSGNLARIVSIPTLFIGGYPWDTVRGDNLTQWIPSASYSIAEAAKLGVNYATGIGPYFCIPSGTYKTGACKHESDLNFGESGDSSGVVGTILPSGVLAGSIGWATKTAVQFLINRSGSSNAGVSGGS